MLLGKLYELAVLTNTLINNTENDFDIGQEVRLGHKFDDLVIRANGNQYTFVQIKLVNDCADNVIDSNVLLGKKKISLDKDDFQLQKYFLSFLRIRDQLNSNDDNSSIRKLIIFTNAHLDHNEINQEVGVITTITHIADNILNTNENLESYKITNPTLAFEKKIRDNLKSDLQILAEEIAKYVTDGNKDLGPIVLDIDCFRYYHTALIDENVMEIKECQHGNKKIKFGKFTQDFIDEKNLSDRAKNLRNKIKTIITEKNKMEKAEWKVSDDFGSRDSENVILLPNYEIKDGDIKDFFNILELRVKQHGVKEILEKIRNDKIKTEFLKYFDTDPKLVEFLINDFIQGWRSERTTQERWLLNWQRSCFIKELEIKIAKPQAIHTTHKHVKYIESIIKKYNLYFRDDSLLTEKYFLERKSTEKYFVVNTASNLLSSIKMLQYLKKKKQQNYIFIDLESLSVKGQIINLIDAFRDIKYSLLILSYNYLEEDDINKILRKLCNITKEHRNKQVIFITQTTVSLAQKIRYKEYPDKAIGIEDVVDSAKIFEQEITIQNRTMQVGDLYKQIDYIIMEKLITNKINIGSNTTETNYLEGAYTELFEEINMDSFVQEILLQNTNNIYIISGIPETDGLVKLMDITENSKLNSIKSQIKVFEQDNVTTLSSGIYVTCDQLTDRQFKEVCKSSPEIKIYLINIKYEGDKSKLILSQIYNPEFYIKGQRFNNEVVFKKDIIHLLASTNLQERFIICGKKVKDIEKWLQLTNDMRENYRANIYNKKIQLVYCDSFNAVSQELVKQSVDISTHVLEFEKDQLIWRKTCGSLENLSKYRTENYKKARPLLDEDDIIKEIEDKKVVIISGEPGIGKSTALNKIIGNKYKLQSGVEESIIMSHWVIKENLKDHLQLIRNIDFRCSGQILIPKIIEFLSQIQKSLNNDVAKSLLGFALTEKKFRKPLLIALDGFDEILDDEDRNKIILILNKLKHNTLAKVWITTRMHFEKTLESKLSTFAIRLKPMNARKVRIYIKTYLKEHLNLILRSADFTNLFNNDDKNICVLQDYIDAFLYKIQEIFKSDVSWFIGTPLQLILMLNGSIKYFKKWVKYRSSQKPEFSYLGNNIWEVYENFTERKYDTYLKKRDITGLKQKLEKTVFDDYHKNLAKSYILESDVKKYFVGLKDILLLAGIVRSDGRNIEFIHPTFQEYFASKLFIHWIEKWSRERQCKLRNLVKMEYLFKHILSKSSYQVIRAFLNDKLLNENLKNAHLLENYYSDEILILAIEENNLGIASFLLNNFQKADVDNSISKYGVYDLPLKTAIMCGNLKILELLVKFRARVENQKNLYSSFLHDACYFGHLHIVKYLIENGTDVNALNRNDAVLRRAVVKVCKYKYEEECSITVLDCESLSEIDDYISKLKPDNVAIVEYPIKKYENISSEDDCGIALMYTAVTEYGKVEIVKYLLTKIKNVINHKNTSRIGFDIAVRNGDFEMVQLLVENGADVNAIFSKGETAMIIGATNPQNLEMIKFFVQRGANVNTKDICGETVVFKAVTHPDNLEMVKYLREVDADFNVKNKRDETVIFNAVDQRGNFVIVEYLIKMQMDNILSNIRLGNRFGMIPLFNAVKSYNLEIVKILVENGANVNATNKRGESILCKAVAVCDLEMVKYLIDKGGDVNFKNKYRNPIIYRYGSYPGNLKKFNFFTKKGGTVLNIAIEFNNFEKVKCLVENGADANATDNYGNPIIFSAVASGNIKMIKYLAQNGAIVDSKNPDGFTALHIAATMKNTNIVRFLLANGVEADLLVLLTATQKDEVKMLKLLLASKKIDSLTKYELYSKLLHEATKNGSLEIVKYLISDGGDAKARDERGVSVIYKAVGYVDLSMRIRYLAISHTYIFKDIVYDRYNCQKDIVKNQLNIVKYVLEKGAHFNVTTTDGKLILKRAIESKKMDILELLINYSNNTGDLNRLAYFIFNSAFHSGNLDMIKFLIETYDYLTEWTAFNKNWL